MHWWDGNLSRPDHGVHFFCCNWISSAVVMKAHPNCPPVMLRWSDTWPNVAEQTWWNEKKTQNLQDFVFILLPWRERGNLQVKEGGWCTSWDDRWAPWRHIFGLQFKNKFFYKIRSHKQRLRTKDVAKKNPEESLPWNVYLSDLNICLRGNKMAKLRRKSRVFKNGHILWTRPETGSAGLQLPCTNHSSLPAASVEPPPQILLLIHHPVSSGLWRTTPALAEAPELDLEVEKTTLRKI